MNRIVPLILAVALFMEMMDATVIATSLPAIAADIGTSPIALKLAMTSYLVALAIFIPISGWMADRFGARNVFRWAIFVFMLGSLACAASYDLFSFVGARFFQGVGGAMMGPIARLVLVRSTSKKDLVIAMAWLTTPALVGPIVGPVVGGYLTTFWGWQWIFLINLPIGVVGIIAATIYLPHTGFRDQRRLDWRGFILIGLAFSGVIFGLSVISLPAIPIYSGILAVIIGAISGWLFVRHASVAEAPLLSPKLLRYELFRTSLIGGMIFRTAFGATLFLLPLMLQLGFGLSPFESGLIIFVTAIGAIIAKFFTKSLLTSFGFRAVLLVTAVLSAVRYAAIGSFGLETPVAVMMGVLLLGGMVHSTFFTSSSAMAFSDVPQEEVGEVSAVMAVTVQLSFALGVALAGGILELRTLYSGHELTLPDFQFSFYVVAGLSLASLLPFLRLQSSAGDNVSGHLQGVPKRSTIK